MFKLARFLYSWFVQFNVTIERSVGAHKMLVWYAVACTSTVTVLVNCTSVFSFSLSFGVFCVCARVCILHCVSKKTSPTFLAITRESIDGFL